MNDVTSDVCLLLTCAHVSVCALRDVGTVVRCSVHCGVWCVTVQGRCHVCVRTVSFFRDWGVVRLRSECELSRTQPIPKGT